ncbi:hypothetical protein SCB49_11457 [unidentified eubacterium SCB49]|nr:hypothetical protein SCB49_11457 [unidentified eubacterium SCB49]
MMPLQQRINAFSKLGQQLGLLTSEMPEAYHTLIRQANAHNGWFTEENIVFALNSWSAALTNENLTKWTSNYTFKEKAPKTIAIVMAGNIPLVGFHDFLSVLISGNHVQVKMSSNDTVLLTFVAKLLVEIAPEFKEAITFTKENLEKFDAVIATGSNNTAKYFEHYFNKYPNIIRKNRNSVAVITGKETTAQMEALADDVFRYFGLGCRNVSKVYLPETYDLDHFFNAMYSWKEVINNHKYMNNYDYNKAVYLMSEIKLLDNEFMLLKEDPGFSSPISVVLFERYKNLEDVQTTLSQQAEHIQAIVADCGIKNEIPFGVAQTPALWDYADGVDTLAFINEL